MAKFIYNNVKNTNIGHISFKFNCKYHPKVFFENEIYCYLGSYSGNKLAKELRKLIKIYYQNLLQI